MQPLGGAVAVLADQRVGDIEDRLRAAVILFKQNLDVVGIILAEKLDVAIVGAAEAVDRLILVAHDKEVAVVRRFVDQQPQHLVLRRVGILELVNQEIGPLALILDAHVQVVAQQQHRAQQQVVEVHGVVGEQRLLIAAVDAPGDLLEIGVRLEGFGRDQVVLAVADVGVDGFGRVALFVEVQVAHYGAHQRHLVGAVVDDPVGLETGRRRLHAQDACADAVKGADGQPAQPRRLSGQRRRAGKLLEDQRHAFAHLAGGLVGEGDGGDVPRRDALLIDHVGDAPRQYARLAGAWAGQHQHRPCHGLDRAFLWFVEVGCDLGHDASLVRRHSSSVRRQQPPMTNDE